MERGRKARINSMMLDEKRESVSTHGFSLKHISCLLKWPKNNDILAEWRKTRGRELCRTSSNVHSLARGGDGRQRERLGDFRTVVLSGFISIFEINKLMPSFNTICIPKSSQRWDYKQIQDEVKLLLST